MNEDVNVNKDVNKDVNKGFTPKKAKDIQLGFDLDVEITKVEERLKAASQNTADKNTKRIFYSNNFFSNINPILYKSLSELHVYRNPLYEDYEVTDFPVEYRHGSKQCVLEISGYLEKLGWVASVPEEIKNTDDEVIGYNVYISFPEEETK